MVRSTAPVSRCRCRSRPSPQLDSGISTVIYVEAEVFVGGSSVTARFCESFGATVSCGSSLTITPTSAVNYLQPPTASFADTGYV